MEKKKLDFRVNENGCFIVTSHRLNKEGYCYLRQNGREQRAHRMIYVECFGEIPEGIVVRHKCDNPSCINPEHLELGTHTENMRDSIDRGRNAKGNKNGNKTINEEIAKKIIALLSNGMRTFEIAKELNISRYVIRGIKNNSRWSHVAV